MRSKDRKNDRDELCLMAKARSNAYSSSEALLLERRTERSTTIERVTYFGNRNKVEPSRVGKEANASLKCMDP